MGIADVIKQRTPLSWRKQLKWVRAQIFERLGSARHSRPALYGLESSLLPLLPERGVYLEIGANDGFDQSNTYYLARFRDWRGILVEPLPDRFEACRRRRRESHCVWAACVAPDHTADVVEIVDNDLMSRTAATPSGNYALAPGEARGVVCAPATTLSEIIRSSPFDHIDFMSIDVEGAELDVLAGLDLARHAPEVLLIETHDIDAVASALAPRMTLHAQPTHHDYVFLRGRRDDSHPHATTSSSSPSTAKRCR
jgi:FkbM family methyltransferase